MTSVSSLRRTLRKINRRLDRPPTATDRPPFGYDWLRTFLPHYLTAAPSRLHDDLAADLRDFHRTRGRRRVYIAPRGAAKTTWLSKAYPLFCACEGVERLTLLLAETGEQAEAYLKAVKAELETNARLAAAYPAACGVGPVWRADRMTLRNGCSLVARGSGGRVLGLTERNVRPTLVVGDDMNQRGDAFSPTTRTRKLDWFLKDVLNVGEPRTNFLAAGTPIHRQAVVCELARGGAWQVRRYKSVTDWPDRGDLWAEWERVLLDLGNDDREHTARAFYEAHRVDMAAGAGVLWPDRFPLYDLMRKRAEIGASAFGSEWQDDTGVEGSTEWPGALFDSPELWFRDWPAGVVHAVQTLDPSKGLSRKDGDYQAHVRLGLGPDGALYAEADLRHDADYVARMLALAEDWQSPELFAESNSTMGLLGPEVRRQITERANTGRWTPTRYFEADAKEPKVARIGRRLDAYLRAGRLRVRNTPGGRLLVEQLREFPNADHDDGPDALATAVWRLHVRLGIEAD